MGLFDLTGHTAVVTGAATGIGEAIVRRLAAAGAVVAVTDIDLPAAERTAGTIPGAFGVHMDVTAPDQVRRAVAQILAATGRIDAFVNNAGIAGKAAPINEQDEEDWHRIVAVNLTGVFHCTRACLPPMTAQGYGRIVMTSRSGRMG